MIYRRGGVYLARLDPTFGVEMKKTRPVVIIQNDVSNEYGRSVIVAPFTSKGEVKDRFTEVLVGAPEGGLKSDSLIRLLQMRVLDKRRLAEDWGDLFSETMQKVDEAIKVSLALVPL